MAPEFKLTIARKENQLYAQATGQSQFKIFPSAEHEFFFKVVEASITFNANEVGEVNSLTLHQGGRNMPAQKIE